MASLFYGGLCSSVNALPDPQASIRRGLFHADDTGTMFHVKPCRGWLSREGECVEEGAFLIRAAGEGFT